MCRSLLQKNIQRTDTHHGALHLCKDLPALIRFNKEGISLVVEFPILENVKKKMVKHGTEWKRREDVGAGSLTDMNKHLKSLLTPHTAS